jgi:hypothetical protein
MLLNIIISMDTTTCPERYPYNKYIFVSKVYECVVIV